MDCEIEIVLVSTSTVALMSILFWADAKAKTKIKTADMVSRLINATQQILVVEY